MTLKSTSFIGLLFLATSTAFAQVSSVGIGLGMSHAKHSFQKVNATDFVVIDGIITQSLDTEPIDVNSFGGGFTFNGNISFLGWLINNMWDDLERGFYIGDYFEFSGGFGPYKRKEGDSDSENGMMLMGSFGLGFQAGYKIPSLPKLASIELRWYLNGTLNNLRSSKTSAQSSTYDDLLNLGLTGRYGAYAVRLDYGYKDYAANLESSHAKPRRFSLGAYWFIDQSKSYSAGSSNAAIGIRYEGFYNYFRSNPDNSINGRNHNLHIELIMMKF